MKATGICIGASTVTRVDVERRHGNDSASVNVVSRTHEGNIRQTLEDLLSGADLQPGTRIAVTGRKFKNLLALSSLSEPEAVENAYAFLKEKYGPADYISCAGGETFTTYQIGAAGKITNIFTGNKCASGTGEFFRQQIKRIGIGIEEAVAVQNIDHPYRVSGRCSVFCKSDCTHALNKGEKKDNIVAGLGRMMALRIVEQLGDNVSRRIWLTGGCARNGVMVEYLRRHAPALVIPGEAGYFEALGSALWALEHETVLPEGGIFRAESKSFAVLPALAAAAGRVSFHDLEPARSGGGGRCILGLDVGSTTTKAVLMAVGDESILAQVYIKTLGDPIKAAKACYASLREQTGGRAEIVGLGVTGSGRQIAGLHALSACVYNEISAHAAAAVHFDPEVDTIFEIGGQDAKYTHIINGVPCDYAMNEACSAGTGSFLEESASEYLNIDVHRIEGVAMSGGSPADFNDQCAAFIGSDIKTAMQENIETGNIVAGLVYSICKNYLNRVKGNRFVGRKIFMQGGVCYNKAVPVAMAALLDRDVVVPPEPGLMGAYGIALMVKEKIGSGAVAEKKFDLDQLIAREVDYREPFTCRGGKTGCDRKCPISRIKIEGKTYPFGGICGLYSGIQSQHCGCSGRDDMVRQREEMVYGEFGQARQNPGPNRPTVGISRSLMVNTLFPLYYNFFQELGLEVVLPGGATEQAAVKKDSAFCYPVNLAHAYFQDLLGLDPDYLFLPHVKGMPVEGGIPVSLACPLVQGESYFLRTTFDVPRPERILAPVLDFSQGFHEASQAFVETGARLGFDRQRSLTAYRRAVEIQEAFGEKCRAMGARFLDELAQTGEKAVVLFGRPYNALVRDGNMGIPEKFTSRGYRVIPYDFLPCAEETPQRKMYWSMGQMILKAAKLVSRHPQLFGVFVTNFSCGPDSFVVGYFRDIMGNKPSLTLELDSHTADAGIDTRIDAFIDVIANYRAGKAPEDAAGAVAVFDSKKKRIRTVNGEMVSLKDPRVRIVVPSMGDLASRHFAAAFRHIGIDAVALDAPAEAELQLGRANSSCKECLPLALTVGSLLRYLGQQGSPGAGNGAGPRDILVYFMPEAPDPCRFGQYHVYTENLLRKMGVTDVALLTLSSGNSYGGLGTRYTRRAWQAMVISDVVEDIRSALLALAVDRDAAMAVFNHLMEDTIEGVAADGWGELKERLDRVAARLAAIPLRQPLADARKVALVGEIYVRRDGFSRQHIVEKLADRGIVVTVAPVEEWIYYCDYTVKNNLSEDADLADKINVTVESFFRRKYEREIKAILARSGLYEYRLIDVDRVISTAEDLISPHIVGEAILTIGTSINDIVDHVDGVITIGPFGCMPSRISEAILTQRISTHKGRIDRRPLVAEVIAQYPHLPYLNIETDGSAFTQQIEIRLEAFALQVERINTLVRKLKRRAGGDRMTAER